MDCHSGECRNDRGFSLKGDLKIFCFFWQCTGASNIPAIFSKIALACYFVATLHYLLLLISQRVSQKIGRVGIISTCFGFLAQSIAIVVQTFQRGYIPFLSARAALFFFAWALVLVYLFVETKYKFEIFGAFALPLALLAGIYSSILPQEIEPIVTYNKGLFLGIHASLAFLGFASFAFAVCTSAMYILQERQLKSKQQGRFYYKLPSLEVLEKLTYKCISIGFPIYTISVIMGIFWALSTRESALDWRFQEIWWIMIWIAYAILLQAHLTFGWRGRKAAYVAISVFVLACIPLLI